MNQSWHSELNHLMEAILGAKGGTTSFWTTAGIGFAALLIGGWLITNFVCSKKKGVVVSFLATTIPFVAAVITWVTLRSEVAPGFQPGTVKDLLPVSGAIVAGLVASMLITRKWLGLSKTGSLSAVLLTYVCVAAAIFLGGTLVRDLDASLNDLSAEKKYREDQAQSLIQ